MRKIFSSREKSRRKRQSFLARGGKYYDDFDGGYFKAVPGKDGSIVIPKKQEESC